MCKYLRKDKLILLYYKCLEKEPMYIPEILRNGNIFTMNEQGKNNELALQKLQTEIEILTSRRKHFHNNHNAIEKKTGQFLDSKNMPEMFLKINIFRIGKRMSKGSTPFRGYVEEKK